MEIRVVLGDVVCLCSVTSLLAHVSVTLGLWFSVAVSKSIVPFAGAVGIGRVSYRNSNPHAGSCIKNRTHQLLRVD